MKKINIFLIIFTVILILCSCGSETTNKSTSGLTSTTKYVPTSIPTSVPTSMPTSEPTSIPTSVPTSEPSVISNAVYASPNGNGSGSFASPYPLKTALTKVSGLRPLYLLEGTYNVSETLNFTNQGSEKYRIKIYAYPGHKVTLDFGCDYDETQEILNGYNTNKYRGVTVSGSYYHIYGITITNARSTGMLISGHNNIIENCIFAKNGNTGCNISGSSSTTIDNWPSNNLIKNCTSYGNYDWDRSDGNYGEDADGFGCKLTSGYGNVYDGCIAYNNSDDGWDLFTKHKTGVIGSVTIRNSIAFRNGYSMSGKELKNGNGFKLGGRVLEVDHIVENSIAFMNKANGFDDNSNPGTISLTDCTAYKNGKKNYAMGRFLDLNNTYTSTWYEGSDLFGPIYNVPKSHNLFYNCISYESTENDSYCGNAQNSYFNMNGNYSIFTNYSICSSRDTKGTAEQMSNPFVSTNIDMTDLTQMHYVMRDELGNVSLKDFLKINSAYLGLGANLA